MRNVLNKNLKLHTKQIAQITRESEHSIKITWYRLRQKPGLEREQILSIFLCKY
jgi:DNA-binding CsgD family transcriptional regulator